MLQKLRKKNNQKGFTLIELMIVIAIIGILAAIAIPNFIAYRNKSFCSRAESDAESIIAAIADYFAIPTYVNVPTGTITSSGGTSAVTGVRTTDTNTGEITGNADPNDGITVIVTDGSSRCPDTYQTANAMWTSNIFTKVYVAE